jgi:hypothetical protein
MGFPRDEAARALALNQNHIESALTTLLGQWRKRLKEAVRVR